MEYRFQTTAYDAAALLPEVRAALDKRMEAHARTRLPGMWKVIDRLPGGARPNEMTKGRRTYRRAVGVLLLMMGLFLLIPGLAKPRELLVPLLAGAFALGAGVYALHSTRKSRRAPFEKQARRLLEGIAAAPAAEVLFSDTGVTLAARPEIPWREIAFYTETPSGFFLNWADQAAFLLKKDLTDGNPAEFAAFLQEKLG